MSKTAAFTLAGLTVNNPNLPVLTPLVEGIQFRYRMAENGEVGTLTDSGPEGNSGIMNGSLAVGDTGLVFKGDANDYVDSQVPGPGGDFTAICVVRPAIVDAGVPMGNFELRFAENYRVGFNLWFTSNASGARYTPGLAIKRPDDETAHQNVGLTFTDQTYAPGEWCLCVLRHRISDRLVSGSFKSLGNTAQVNYSNNYDYQVGENIWLGRVQGGYAFDGAVGYSAFWDTYLDDDQVAAQVKTIRTDLARRGIDF